MLYVLMRSMLMWALIATTNAYAFHCNSSCRDQCRDRAYWQRPLCEGQCNTWRVVSCSDISDPLASVVGEIGSGAYPTAATTMTARGSGRAQRYLTSTEKLILRQFFGSLVDEAKLYFDVPLMDKIGRNPHYIDLDQAQAQTYGKDIYFRHRETFYYTNFVEYIAVLGHELVHTQQYVGLGSSLSRFGRDYFKGWAGAGFSYHNIPMEREAHNKEPLFRQAAETYLANGGQIVEPDRNWFALSCIFNESNQAINYSVQWGDGPRKSFQVAPRSWRSHSWRYEFQNENRSPALSIRFDYLLSNQNAWKNYTLKKFASSHRDCNRLAQRNTFRVISNGQQLELFYDGESRRSYAVTTVSDVDEESIFLSTPSAYTEHVGGELDGLDSNGDAGSGLDSGWDSLESEGSDDWDSTPEWSIDDLPTDW
jgi:hypothetical protein